MKIAIVGTGYVGLTLSCLADFGHEIILIDCVEEKVNLINNGRLPIYEAGLKKIIKENLKRNRLKATTSYNVIKDSDIIFICVGTPSKEDGSIDLSQIENASASIGEQLKDNKYRVVVVKSTILPRTTKNIIIPILEEYSQKKVGKDFGICVNPEFLREGTSVHDFLNPDKIVIGCYDKKSYSFLERVYAHFDKRIPRIMVDLTTAEMIKYVQNAALATRISFINEIANICEKYEVDVYDVAYAIGLDPRIGPKFLRAGCGFGGSCLPKDVKALLASSTAAGVKPLLLKNVLKVNETQPYRMIELAKKTIGDLKNKKIAVLGLAFKPNTDDMRDAPSVVIIRNLLEHGAKVKVYDPKAMENAKKIFGNSIEYCRSKEDCIKDSDLCFLVTEWDEFRNLDLSSVKCPIVDGRRVLDPQKAKQYGICYKGIGWKGN